MKLIPIQSNIDALLRARLSARELSVVGMLACGWGHPNIAANIGCSAKTIGTYQQRVLDKLDLVNRAELTAFALLNGLMRIEGTNYTVESK